MQKHEVERVLGGKKYVPLPDQNLSSCGITGINKTKKSIQTDTKRGG